MQRVKFLIIGAGPTGLGAAYRLKELGENSFLILERNTWVGGLAASFTDAAGFTWDIGGHVQFSHYPYFDRAMEAAIPGEGWLRHERESWIWMDARFIPYPFQNNIRFLPKEKMWECLCGLVSVTKQNGTAEQPSNFRDWIYRSFGPGVAEHFMMPYNFKVWAFPPEELNFRWIGERVATVNLEKILENILFEKDDISWGPNRTFQFPLHGGTGSIWRSVANLVGMDRIRLGCGVRRVKASGREVLTENGDRIRFDNLLSTMPLDILVHQIPEARPSMRTLAASLKHSSSNIIGIGVRGAPVESLAKKCWMYFPEDRYPFYRMTMFSNYSPRNAPSEECYSLMCEVSESEVKQVERDRLIDECIRSLQEGGLLPREQEIASRWLYSARYGYPTPSLERDGILGVIIPHLDGLGLFSRGRFGGWKYEVSNQDHSFMQGVEWVDFILKGISEKTFRPDSAEDPNLGAIRNLKEVKTPAPEVSLKVPHKRTAMAASKGDETAASEE